MNYYSIEFFKHYLKIINKDIDKTSYDSHTRVKLALKKLSDFVKDREKNNESAYNKKWMTKPVFKDL